MGGDLDLAVANLLDGDGVTKVANTTINLDLVLKELLEGGGVEDLVAGGLRGVDDELATWRKYFDRQAKGSIAFLLTFFVCLPALPDFFYMSEFDLSLLFHAIISLEGSPERPGQQQSGVKVYVLSEEEPLLRVG